MRKVYGVGVNDCPGWSSDSTTSTYNEYKYRVYQLWYDILRRCYSSKCHERHPTYKGCEVCVRWRTLSNFAEDIKSLPGYDLWLNNPRQRVSLDKDILGNDSMEYSPSTCSFVTIGENNAEMVTRTRSRRVKATNLTTGEVREYLSTADTEKDGFLRDSVSKVCRGKQKLHKGWKFEYLGGDKNEPIGKE